MISIQMLLLTMVLVFHLRAVTYMDARILPPVTTIPMQQTMMEVVPGDRLDPAVEMDYMDTIRRYAAAAPVPQRIERQAFYARAKGAFAIVMTGELRKYGNLLLKKGVTPIV